MQTRGRKEALALKGAGGTGRNIKGRMETATLREIARTKDRDFSDQFLDELTLICSRYDFKECTGMNLLEAGSEAYKRVEKIENVAGKLALLLRESMEDEDSKEHFRTWIHMWVIYDNFDEVPDEHETEHNFIKLLQKLADAKGQLYQRVPIAGHWHGLIKELLALFKAHGLEPSAEENGVFIKSLSSIDDQFPGLIFPLATDPATGRRRYVRNALKDQT